MIACARTRLAGALAALGLLCFASPALAAKKPLGPADRIDLNRAGVAELMRLPGVGQKRAQAIVDARTKKPFQKAEDVLAVKGVGPAWLARVRGNVVVNGAAPVATAAAQGPSTRK